MIYAQVVFGFLLLLFAAEIMIRAAVILAQRLAIPPIVVGMTVIAIGTSAPELIIGVQSSLTGAEGLALGNVIGSNIANVLLVLGGAALISPISSKGDTLSRDTLGLIIGTLLFIVFCVSGDINIIDGFILLLALFIFLFTSYRKDDKEIIEDNSVNEIDVNLFSIIIRKTRNVFYILLLGIIGLLYGANLLVDGSVNIARSFGVSEEVIGLTIIAIGTSLPELTASVVAALRGQSEVALGNIIGSNLFNILGITGVVAILTPLTISPQLLMFDVWVMLLCTLSMVPILIFRRCLGRSTALIMLICYLSYIICQGIGVDTVLSLI